MRKAGIKELDHVFLVATFMFRKYRALGEIKLRFSIEIRCRYIEYRKKCTSFPDLYK